MKNMKRILLVMMCTGMIGSMTACGNRNNTSDNMEQETTGTKQEDSTENNKEKANGTKDTEKDRNVNDATNGTGRENNGVIDDAVDDVKDGIEDAADDLTDKNGNGVENRDIQEENNR